MSARKNFYSTVPDPLENSIQRLLTRNGIGEARGMPVNERVLDVPSADAMSSEQHDCLTTEGGETHHLEHIIVTTAIDPVFIP